MKIVKTECPEHRRVGYKYEKSGRLVCRACGLSQQAHETNAETLARLNKGA